MLKLTSILGAAALAVGGVLAGSAAADEARLEQALADRPEALKARDQYRHPKETLTFFGIEPGMTVIDVLPGEWYGRILTNYLGSEGRYIGAEYSLDLKRRIYGERYERRREEFESWEETFPAKAVQWAENPPEIMTMRVGAAPAELEGAVDAYLFFRALHHLNRFDPAMLDAAAAEAFALVKPGGIVGVVQHRAPEDASDEWASGDNGYIKQSRVIEAFTGAGFTLEAASEINANPKDQPTEEDYVWRLPPSRSATDEMKAIGESDRMTLKFRKPE